jgi:hypothetical protein
MHDNNLTAFQASQLQYLKSQEHKMQKEVDRSDSLPNSDNELSQVRQELKEFIRNLRMSGKKI